jgi:hypothetical protein
MYEYEINSKPGYIVCNHTDIRTHLYPRVKNLCCSLQFYVYDFAFCYFADAHLLCRSHVFSFVVVVVVTFSRRSKRGLSNGGLSLCVWIELLAGTQYAVRRKLPWSVTGSCCPSYKRRSCLEVRKDGEVCVFIEQSVWLCLVRHDAVGRHVWELRLWNSEVHFCRLSVALRQTFVHVLWSFA